MSLFARYLLSLLWVHLVFCSNAQIDKADNAENKYYFFTNYTTENGLSDHVVTCFVKDPDGFLWIGTNAGLNRFNGYEFTVYKSLASDSSTLPSNTIHQLVIGPSGELWIATNNGICVYEKTKNSFKRLPFISLSGKTINSKIEFSSILQDKKGNIWVTTIGNGLAKFNPERGAFFQIFFPDKGQSMSHMPSVIEEKDGTLWISSYYHLFHFNPADNSFKEFKNILNNEGRSSYQALRMYKDNHNDNFIWIGTWGSGLVHFNKQTGEAFSYKFNPGGSRNLDNIVFETISPEQNLFWMATNRGIIEFDCVNKKFIGIVSDSISEKPVVNTEVRSLYRDRENIIWIGSISGMANIHPLKQNFVSTPLWRNIPDYKYYYDITAEKIYGLRYYTNRSLIIYDRNTGVQNVFPIPQADELRAEPFSVIKDNEGIIWIGTTRGIYTFNEATRKFSLLPFEKELGLPERSLLVQTAYKDHIGNLWFGIYQRGMLKVDAESKSLTPIFNDKHNRNSFPLCIINRITGDKDTSLFVCDEFGGIVKLNTNTNSWEHFNSSDAKFAALQSATDLAIDKYRRIWVSTKNYGLVCIDSARNVKIYIRDASGQIVDEQKSIVIDNAGKLWLAASRGIFQFDPETESFRNFSRDEGFPDLMVRDPLQLLSDGRIAYYFKKGIFAFEPLSVNTTPTSFRTHLISLMINGKAFLNNHIIDGLDTLALMYTQNNLTIEFAAINFFNPSATLYSYMLEGNDNHWSVPSRNRSVNFSQLSPGNYWLRIRAGENSQEKKLFIQIVPAWWQTALFRWLAILSSLAFVVWLVRFIILFQMRKKYAMLERQREIESIRTRISRDIHDDIGTGLTRIKLMSRQLAKEDKNGNVKESIDKITSASDELIQSLGEIVWTVNPANDSIDNTLAYMRSYAVRLFSEQSLIQHFILFPDPDSLPELFLTPEIKRNLLLIFKEAMNNCIKHSKATEIKIHVQLQHGFLCLVVADNGTGFKDENQWGNGLKNMQKRAESMKANLQIVSLPGKGTEVRLNLNLNTIKHTYVG